MSLPAEILKGKVAFITGGGTGLGKAMALTFSLLGARVAIASRRLNVLEEAAAEIQRKSQNQVLPIELNVKDASQVAKAADACEREFGLPDIVVNNAAGNFISPTQRLSPNAVKSIVDIVLLGTTYVTLEFGKRLISAGKKASFLAITTPYARQGSPFVTASAAAKAGVETWSKSLAAEWGKYGLRFNCIAPGPIYTEGAFSRLDPSGEFAKSGLGSIPAGRLGTPEELANLAAFMVSDLSDWMNGAIVDFDGGQQRFLAGTFSGLHRVTEQQWDSLEQMIRSKTGKAKI